MVATKHPNLLFNFCLWRGLKPNCVKTGENVPATCSGPKTKLETEKLLHQIDALVFLVQSLEGSCRLELLKLAKLSRNDSGRTLTGPKR